jgi:hypothetical protein
LQKSETIEREKEKNATGKFFSFLLSADFFSSLSQTQEFFFLHSRVCKNKINLLFHSHCRSLRRKSFKIINSNSRLYKAIKLSTMSSSNQLNTDSPKKIMFPSIATNHESLSASLPKSYMPNSSPVPKIYSNHFSHNQYYSLRWNNYQK